MKILSLILFLNIFSFSLFGQRAYYITESTTQMGVNLEDGGDRTNSKFCQVKNGEIIKRYTPNEVVEYGFKDGRVYVSKQIQIGESLQRVFMERLLTGENTLYYYKGKKIRRFYIEKDSVSLIEISKKSSDNSSSFHEKLAEITSDCEYYKEISGNAGYTKYSIAKFISGYNSCEKIPFPYTKYGFFVGLIHTRLIASRNNSNEIFESVNFNADQSIYFGAFFDAPIKASDFSTYLGLGFYHSIFSWKSDFFNSLVDVSTSLSTIEVPVLLRYTVPHIKIRPYVNIGLNYALNIVNDNTITQMYLAEDQVQKITDKYNLASDQQIGYAYGAGIQYQLDYKKSVFFEIRVNREFSIPFSKGMLSRKGAEFMGGISF
ncbi:MAG: outer membrane beta-barrel protein [Bacteroidales bacterium]|nr:outer membrane beta-barrel protein [Bacteroidales bacterium]